MSLIMVVQCGTVIFPKAMVELSLACKTYNLVYPIFG